MSVSGHLPNTGERIECAHWMFEVVDLDGKRIDKVLAISMQPAEPPPDTAEVS
jgi:putative hemolysin